MPAALSRGIVVLGAALLACMCARCPAMAAISAEQDIARFRDAKLCVQAAMVRKPAEDFVAPAVDTELPAEERAYQAREVEAFHELPGRAKLLCPKSDAEAFDGRIYELAARAAEAGDRQAASCYASGAFPMPQKLWDEPEYREQFRKNTQRFLDRGVQAGDWSMVKLAGLRYSPRRRPWRQQQIPAKGALGEQAVMGLFDPGGDVELAYRITWLKKLGTGNGLGRWGDEGYLDWLGKQLSAEQRKAGVAWAEDAMARSFGNRRYNWTDMEPCSFQ